MEKDPLLSSVLRFVSSGWPMRVDNPSVFPYYTKRSVLMMDVCLEDQELSSLHLVRSVFCRSSMMHTLAYAT